MDRACLPTPLGPLTVIADDEAIVAVHWGRRAPAGAVCTSLLDRALEQLEAYFARALTRFELPLRLAGSDHERRVWAVMQTIPFGQTISYADTARAVGSAPRAVGRACGRNPLTLIVPCHRVIAAGGGLGGYSGGQGPATKRALLDLERTAAANLRSVR